MAQGNKKTCMAREIVEELKMPEHYWVWSNSSPKLPTMTEPHFWAKMACVCG